MNRLSIGEISKALGISVQAIRLYQRKGLVEPTFVNDQTGYRYYSEEDMGVLWRIKVLKSAGFSLDEIKEMDTFDKESLEELVRLKRKELEETIKQNILSMKYLDRQLHALEIFDDDYVIELKRIDKRYGISFSPKEPTSAFEHFCDLASFDGLYGLNQEVTFEPSRRLRLVDGKFTFKDLFAVNKEGDDSLSIQEGGLYLTTYLKGKVSSDVAYKKMINYAKENGLTPRGDAIELLLINNSLVNDARFNMREIQMAVMKD